MQRTEFMCEAESPLAARLATLEAENLRLRAALVVRDSALAFARQDQEALAAAVPGLRRRAELTRRVEWLGDRLQALMREQRDLPVAHRQMLVTRHPA